MTEVVTLRGLGNLMVPGEVTGVHLRDERLIDGRFEAARFAPLARLGQRDYAVAREVFALARPGAW